jgi:hypothetical protein
MSAEGDPQDPVPDNAPQPAPALTSEQANIFLKADLKNIGHKLKAGRTLSAAERNTLKAIAAGNKPTSATFATNQVELADALGVDRKTIQRARKREGNPGVRPDGRWEIAAWREFLNRDRQVAFDDDDDEPDATRERARNLLLKNDKLETELAILRKEWIPASDIEKWGGALGASIRKVISTIHLCAPQVVGVSVAEAESRLKEIEDEILQQLHLIDANTAAWKEISEPAP